MLKDKVVMISGAGSGLGRALSQAFCREGAKVIGLGRQVKTLEETQALILDENASASFDFFVLDVSDAVAVQSVTDQIVKKYDQIDYLYNNAAVYPKVNFLDESAEGFAQAININIMGIANLSKSVLPIMIRQKTGRIFNLGSWADLSPIADSAAYSASKGAVRALTKAIAADIAHYDVDVQVHEWIPGHLNTQMSDYTGIDPALSASWGLSLAAREIAKKNTIFMNDQEWLPPKSLKQRVKDKLLFWR